MSVNYDLYKTYDLAKSGEEQPLHARVVQKGSYDAKEFIEQVSIFQHIPHAQVLGTMDAITNELKDLLLKGYSVELEGLGYFSLSLKVNKKTTNPKELRSPSVSLKDVNLRINRQFRKDVESKLELQLVHSPFRVKDPLEQKECLKRLNKFLENHPFINRQDYVMLTGKTKKQALEDIKTFIEKGILEKYGNSRSIVYIKANQPSNLL